MIRLVAIDIDGTLLDSRWRLPARNRDAVLACAARGVEVALVTGRAYGFARPIVDLLPCPVTVIASNGALVRLSTGVTALRHTMPRAIARTVLAAGAAYRRNVALTFDRPRDGQMVFERVDRSDPVRLAYAERNIAYLSEVAPLESALTEDPLVVMFNGAVAAMRQLAALLRELPEAPAFSVNLTEYEDRDISFVDVLTAGCTKGATLAEWARRQGYARGEVMALGDNLNDVGMLEAAGLPVVMGNAVEALRARGWHITASNDEAGVADAIDRFVLTR
ncbi:MAG TPA: HAD-IIB family hydrolase [Vicinamibacterales bacterium]|nr:HAD-IIB family hydrolase [Vicinamibacterales bacterium]HPW20490.1 HAD-IIB family hydrolase [Vicinamibacterales bacterium]